MSKTNTDKIEKEANDLADVMYACLHDFPEEEKWVTASKLRSSANDLMFFVAQAAGNTIPSGAEYEWGNAHKHAKALRTMYVFAAKQKYTDLEPEVVVRLDNLLKQIEDQSTESEKRTEEANDKDLEHWREKYKVWKAMNDEN